MGVQFAAYLAVLIVLILGGRLVARGSPSGRTKGRAAVLH